MSVTFSAAPDQIPGYYTGRGPSCNFHNVGAMDLLRLLNLPAEPWGFLATEAIPKVRRSIIRLLSVPRTRQTAVRPAIYRKRYFECAQTDEPVQGRLRELDEVLAYAQSIGGHVVWS